MVLVVILILGAILGLVLYLRNLKFKRVVRLFEDESVSVFGARGSGKDMLMSNVCAYRKKPYVSNVPYTKDLTLYTPFDLEYISLGGNTFENFVNGNFTPYKYPLPDKVDIYISDAGVHFPAQYNDKLNRMFPEIPLCQALLRHLGDCNLHFNTQYLARVWDKFREQSELYIYCRRCKVLFGKFVFQKIYLYDKYESARDKVKPFNLPVPLFGKQVKTDIKLAKAKFEASFGNIIPMRLFYIKKSKYDSRRFKKILEQGSFEV